MEARQRPDGIWEVLVGRRPDGSEDWWPAASWFVSFTRFEPPDGQQTDLSIADALMAEGWTPPATTPS